MRETVRYVLEQAIASRSKTYVIREGALDRLMAGYEALKVPGTNRGRAIMAWLMPALEAECEQPY